MASESDGAPARDPGSNAAAPDLAYGGDARLRLLGLLSRRACQNDVAAPWPRVLLPQGQRRLLLRDAELTCTVIVVVHLAVAAAIFRILEETWTYADALYFSISTLTTVGYGDFTPPANAAGRVFTILFIWSNLLVVSAVLGILASRVELSVSSSGSGGTLIPLLGLVALMLLLAAGYSFLEERSWTDGLYFSTLTLSTVGYGHLAPISGATKLLLCPALLVGVTAVGNLATSLTDAARKLFGRSSGRSPLVVSLCAVAAGGVAFSRFGAQQWSLLEGCYFAAVTMTTVGYGDYSPVATDAEKLLAVALMWASVVLLSAWLGEVGASIVSISEALSEKAPSCWPGIGTGNAPSRRRFRQLCFGCLGSSPRWRRLFPSLALLSALQFGGGFFFSLLESWSFLDGVYFAAVTLSTVGYGDLAPVSPLSRGAAVCFILVGVPATADLVLNLSSSCAEAAVDSIEQRPSESSDGTLSPQQFSSSSCKE